jgi:hypothetical protein
MYVCVCTCRYLYEGGTLAGAALLFLLSHQIHLLYLAKFAHDGLVCVYICIYGCYLYICVYVNMYI